MADHSADDSGAVQMRLLGAERAIDGGELAELYSYPADHDGVWLRANFIASLDGGATFGGKSGQLGGPGDRAVFGALRETADVILVGAGTVRTEGYAGARPNVAARQHRQARGQSEVPQVAIVSRSGRLERDMPVFTRTEVAPLVCTCTVALDHTRRTLADLAEVVDCSVGDPESVDSAAVLGALAERGLRRVLTEGGPMLFSSFVARNLLDELCLTIAPTLVGGSAGRIATGPEQVLTGMRRAHILSDDDGYLYTRYVRSDA
ncbi:pyrimidine reductase family protein [Candidatus Mycobacterium wuenschmannii]|uniref:Pyrimidine reductase family protein n=1 Tax=Candidatus Mycobacterium wuenschmannii TaxID=3027808 RepID=A0ABY8VZR8_9MYCO|nr:pyrimidine reductase family protein [Candidatus Mycobacterium wuenschmannii]WIM88465.1 pyrimidine reductase family protein [Candidatus Mycobacterium wuenschmannii]